MPYNQTYVIIYLWLINTKGWKHMDNTYQNGNIHELYVIRDDLCDAETFSKKLWRGLAYGCGLGTGFLLTFGVFMLIGMIIVF